MKEHPILFSGAMVRAILAGTKTQTRRVVTPRCLQAAPGDRLWVRETWRETGSAQRVDGAIPEWGTLEQVRYAADDVTDGPWRPSIFMPRWASRLTLDVLSVRDEQLQAISEADAIAEGLRRNEYGNWLDEHSKAGWNDPRNAYHYLWDGINDARGYGWDSNPLVRVFEFRRASA